MKITGFDKIFLNNEVIIDFKKPLNLLLGGNGLGKTTLLQCIIYGLTGGLNSGEVESDKNFRWGNEFFKRRVNADKITSADIEINFQLEDNVICIHRGISSNRVSYLELNGRSLNGNTYEDVVVEVGKYDNYGSFVFIVNRLLYLPESRRSLTWDYDAQARALMILSNDIVNEKRYRELRAVIKNLDSMKRHTTVRINKIQSDIQKETSDNAPIIENNDEAREQIIKRKNILSKQLQEVLLQREKCSTNLKEHEIRREVLVKEISEITQIVRSYEADFLSNSLQKYGDDEALLFEKTITYGICPCCGEKTTDFQNLTKNRIAEGQCIVCGTKHHENTDTSIDNIENYNSQLNEKLQARDNINKHIFHLRNQIQIIDDDIFTIRKDINTIDYSTFVNADNAENIEEDMESLENELSQLLSTRENLESDIKMKTTIADQMYKDYLNNFEERNIRLATIYKKMATSFLGKEVTLTYERSPDRFVDLNYLIPVFDDEPRKGPEDCSEAQRFFLDIAFRMSVIILNQELTKTNGTFICETPESALDVSYVNNVVKMFCEFMENGNRLVLSNNLQKMGLAHLLISECKAKKKEYYVFDLLEYGRLSEVQRNSAELFEIRDNILRGE
jgi:DNA repair exonuclease SbcCD ATPase subunit